jgi:hypothetical protein
MALEPIKVECYAGGRANERPRRVVIDGREHTVARLIKESVEQSRDRSLTRRYTVLTSDGLVLELISTEDGNWYLQSARRV